MAKPWATPWALIVWPSVASSRKYKCDPPVVRYFRTREDALDAIPAGAERTSRYLGTDPNGFPAMVEDKTCAVFSIVNICVEAEPDGQPLTAPTDEQIMRGRAETTPRQTAAYRRHQTPRFPVTTRYVAGLGASGELRGQRSKHVPKGGVPRKSKLTGKGQLSAVCTTADALALLAAPGVLEARVTARHGCSYAR